MDIVLIVGRGLNQQNAPKADLYFPEAYTHPAKVWQKVKDLIRLARHSPNADRPFRIVTHSEALVSRFGEAVSNDEGYNAWVEVHQEGDILRCYFDADGYLKDPWSFDFFSD